MDVNLQVNRFPRTFGRIFLMLRVRQYSLSKKRKSGYILVSPEFHVRGYKTTTWQVQMTPYEENETDEYFTVELYKLDKEVGDEKIWCDLSLSFLNEEGTLLMKIETQSYFHGNTPVRMDGSTPSRYDGVTFQCKRNIFGALQFLPSDTLYLHFKLLVKHILPENDVAETSDTETGSLPCDMTTDKTLRKSLDTTLRVRGFNVAVHKKLLRERSPYFKRLFKKNKGKNVFDIDIFDYDTVIAVLSYLYTRNLIFVLRKPSNAIGDCVEHFEIKEVMQYYIWDHLEFEVTIEV